MPKAVDVFTPTSVPTYSYVDRGTHKLEEQIKNAFQIKNLVVSLSGPSKSGKTVLINKSITPEETIKINGAQIKSADDLWETVLDWMGTPEETQVVSKKSIDAKASVKAGGEAGIPFVAKGKAEGEIAVGGSTGTETRTISRNGGLNQVIREIANSDFVVFIDDFHYIPREIQPEIGRQIKAAAEAGIRICTASVPHRSDDVVRSNSELTGRLAAVDVSYWSIEELAQIANTGFRELNVDLAPKVINEMATQAFGSPQLMQAICLNLCFRFNIKDSERTHARLDVSNEELRDVFERTSTMAGDFSSLLEGLHSGPKQRGSERRIFDLSDGTRGDAYRSVLLGLTNDPAALSITYDRMLARVNKVCVGDSPSGSSVAGALAQMSLIAEKFSPKALEWDENVLDIIEPYFLFYLRYSPKLRQLASA